MTVDLSRLKKIKSSDTNLTFGYCREAHQQFFVENNPYYYIQPLIVYTCLAYYHIKHEWDISNMSKECIVNGDYIEKIKELYDTTNLLKQEISNGIHEYKFKIINTNAMGEDYYDIGIGITSSKYFQSHKDDLITQCYQDYDTGYGYTTSKGILECWDPELENSDYGAICKQNDIVTMTVDLENGQIKYKVNDIDFGIAFHKIPNDTYRIALYLFGKGSKVQILN